MGRSFAIAAAALVASVGAGASGCAFVRSTSQFRPLPGDARVRYEPGAEAMAADVAAALPEAMRIVEAAQYSPFLRAPDLFVCSSLRTFGSYGGDVRSGGYLANGRLFISPKPENTRERVPRLVAHELSHLHLEQRLGLLGTRRIPTWFLEGLAALVSGGGGAEGVSEDEARHAMAAGRAFEPEPRAGLWHHDGPSHYGLPPHLFYREGAVFLGDLRRRDEARFRAWILAIAAGRPLDAAFAAAFDQSLRDAWAALVR